jgi:hypothetical protein
MKLNKKILIRNGFKKSDIFPGEDEFYEFEFYSGWFFISIIDGSWGVTNDGDALVTSDISIKNYSEIQKIIKLFDKDIILNFKK